MKTRKEIVERILAREKQNQKEKVDFVLNRGKYAKMNTKEYKEAGKKLYSK